MSRYDYDVSQELAAQGHPFYALVMTAMRQADTDNLERLRSVFPDTFEELMRRYNAPGGRLPEERCTCTRCPRCEEKRVCAMCQRCIVCDGGHQPADCAGCPA